MKPIQFRWRPHTEKPAIPGPMTALIAEPDDDLKPGFYLIGIYYWKDGAWHREMSADPPMPPAFFWVPEEEILPRVEAQRAA